MFIAMTTWRSGRRILGGILSPSRLPTQALLDDIRRTAPIRVPGTAVFMDSNPIGTPTALLHNLKHNHILHQRVVFLTVVTRDVPYVDEALRVEHEYIGENIHRLVVSFGFAEDPDVPAVLARTPMEGGPLKLMETTFFVSSERILSTEKPGMARWKERLFSLMSRNATEATRYFRIPAGRVIELGMQVEM
jgi:KUP system potassium uptake protein